MAGKLVVKHGVVAEEAFSNNPKDKIIITAQQKVNYRNPGMVNQALALDIDPNKGTVKSSNVSNNYVSAEVLIDNLVQGNITFATLSLQQKNYLYDYLYKFNPYISRTIDLHALLPLSTFRIQKPSTASNSICRDYIHNFFERMMNACDFTGAMLKAVRYYHLFGKAEVLVLDDYWYLKDTIMTDREIGAVGRKDRKTTKEERKEVDEIVKKYEGNPKDVKWRDREKVLKTGGFDFNLDYTGPRKIKVLKYSDIKSIKRNDDIGYAIYELYRPTHIDQAWQQFLKMEREVNKTDILTATYADKAEKDQAQAALEEKFIARMVTNGYTRGFVRTMLDTRGKETYTVDTDPYNQQGMYIATFFRKINEGDDSSAVNRILESAVDYTVSRRRDREKANMAYKQNRLFSLETGTPQQAAALQQEIVNASAAKEGYDIITNLKVSYNDLSLDVKDRMDFQELKMNSQQDILTGLGMSDSLLSGGESYSGAFLKVELLTTEYQAFRNEFSRFVQEQLFKPTAVKRGFISKDEWGNNTVLIPTVRFDKMSIARGTEDFNVLQGLVQSKILPVKSLLQQLGFDYEEVQNDLRLESTSVFNMNTDATMGAAMQQFAATIAADKDFIKRISDTLKLGKDFEQNAYDANKANLQMMVQQAQMANPESAMGGEAPEAGEQDTGISDEQLLALAQSGNYSEDDFKALVDNGQISPEQFSRIQEQMNGANK